MNTDTWATSGNIRKKIMARAARAKSRVLVEVPWWYTLYSSGIAESYFTLQWEQNMCGAETVSAVRLHGTTREISVHGTKSQSVHGTLRNCMLRNRSHRIRKAEQRQCLQYVCMVRWDISSSDRIRNVRQRNLYHRIRNGTLRNRTLRNRSRIRKATFDTLKKHDFDDWIQDGIICDGFGTGLVKSETPDH